jgi:hypothetical protein
LSFLEGAAPILKGAAASEGDDAGCLGYLLSITPCLCCCLILTVVELGFLLLGFWFFPFCLDSGGMNVLSINGKRSSIDLNQL